ncbi:MAG TPA: hypothetical protein VEH76_00740 [Methylocystis sp.]|nr:hypothetical protein [Methylocystis sp.]
MNHDPRRLQKEGEIEKMWKMLATLIVVLAYGASAMAATPVSRRLCKPNPEYIAAAADAVKSHIFDEVGSRLPRDRFFLEGDAACRFCVEADGSIRKAACAGTTPGHARALQLLMESAHVPPPPCKGFCTSQPVHFYR